MATTKRATAVRLTDDGKRLLEELARRMGVSQTAVMELLIREKAKAEGVTVDAKKEPVAA